MRIVLQRASRAEVRIDGEVVGQIGKGFVLLVGITHEDTAAEADRLAKKVAQMRVFETERDFYLGRVNVLPFKTPHDANESVGFVFRCGAGKLSILTDAGHITDHMLDAVAGSDLILIESNHDVDMLKAGPYPFPLKRRILGDNGHLSNDACGAALYGRGVRRAVLGHLSRENNFESLALETVRAALRASDIPDEAFALSIAHRDRIGEMFEID